MASSKPSEGLVENNHNLEIQHSDDHHFSHYSVETFEALNLRPELLNGVLAMGFVAPSKIQKTALPNLLVDPPQNMICLSQSRTGKTVAFVLAMLSRVDTSKNYPHVVCILPTYELAMHTGEVAKKMAQFCPDIKIKCVVQGEMLPENHFLKEHILIGTPGKLLDWAMTRCHFDPYNVTVFVLDNADILLCESNKIRKRTILFKSKMPEICQMILFSATYNEDVIEVAEIPNPLVLTLPVQESLTYIKQYYVVCNHDEAYGFLLKRFNFVYNFLRLTLRPFPAGKTIIFCRDRQTVSWLAENLANNNYHAVVLTSEMGMDERTRNMKLFREGQSNYLITICGLARGIDTQDVAMVLNFDLPVYQSGRTDYQTYLRCIDRTGFSGKGVAVNLVGGPSSPSMAVLQEIEGHFGSIPELNPSNETDIRKFSAWA